MKKMDRTEYQEHKKKIKYSVGGGDAAILMGFGFQPIFTRFLQKLGDIEKTDQTEAMEIGLEIEETIDKIFRKRTGVVTREAADIWIDDEFDFMVGAIDRVSDKYIIEYKNTGEYMKDKWQDDYPMNAYCQVQWYMMLDGNQRLGAIAGLIGGNKFTCVIDIEPDFELQEKMKKRAIDFYHHLKNRNYEAVEITDKDSDAIKEKFSEEIDLDMTFPKEELLQREVELKEMISYLKKERKILKNKIRWLLEDYNQAHTDNFKLTNKITVSNRFNTRKFKKENPKMYKNYTKQSKYKTLRIKRVN